MANSAPVYSAEWKIDPTLRFGTGYNDNIRLSTDNELSSAEATFSPRAVFSVETPTSGASGEVGFDFRRFEEDSDLDENNSRISIRSFHSMERTRLGLNLNFIKDTTLDSQLEATGLVFDRIRVKRTNASPNWSYTFNDRTQFSASYTYNDTKYLNADGTGFVDFNTNSASASLNRIMSKRTDTSITLSRTVSNNGNKVRSTNTSLQGGASHRFNETLSASLFVGARRTEVDFSQNSRIPIRVGDSVVGFIPLTQDISSSDWGLTLNAKITKNFLRGKTSLSASRDISNDINGQPIEVTRLQLSGEYGITKILLAKLKLEFYSSQNNNDAAGSLSREYYVIEPEFIWDIKKFWSLSGSYRYRRQTFDDISSDAVQNAAYLTLTYRWPRIAVSR